jgi:hypothetical protein
MSWKCGDLDYHFDDDGRVRLSYVEDAEGNPRVLGRWAEILKPSNPPGARHPVAALGRQSGFGRLPTSKV